MLRINTTASPANHPPALQNHCTGTWVAKAQKKRSKALYLFFLALAAPAPAVCPAQHANLQVERRVDQARRAVHSVLWEISFFACVSYLTSGFPSAQDDFSSPLDAPSRSRLAPLSWDCSHFPFLHYTRLEPSKFSNMLGLAPERFWLLPCKHLSFVQATSLDTI